LVAGTGALVVLGSVEEPFEPVEDQVEAEEELVGRVIAASCDVGVDEFEGVGDDLREVPELLDRHLADRGCLCAGFEWEVLLPECEAVLQDCSTSLRSSRDRTQAVVVYETGLLQPGTPVAPHASQ
jgi:hypothetical protein